MRALIVEDESAATQNLRSILRDIEPPIDVVAHCESVVESVEYIGSHAQEIDIIFMDIHLADGDAFKIFERIDVPCPIIFTTAYDQYALQAFKVNSIDYLLKPIKSEEVRRALSKLQHLTYAESAQYNDRIRQVAKSRAEATSTLLVHVRDKIIPLKVADIAFVYTSNEKVVAHSLDGQCYPLDKSLDALFSQLDASVFFRANRQFIISRAAVLDVSVWFGGRLAVNLKAETPERIIIPKAKTAEFKEWLTVQN